MKALTPLLALTILCPTASAANDPPASPGLDGRLPVEEVLELSKDGWIDWTAGRVYAWGRILDISPLGNGRDEGQEKMAATLEARQTMRTILGGLRVDAEGYLSQGEGRRELIGMLSDGARKIQDRARRGRYLEAKVEVLFYGLSGLASAILGTADSAEPREDNPPQERKPGKAPTGVIIDARGTDLRPALLPRILAPDGRVLWSNEQMDPLTLTSRGLAAYGKVRRTAGPEPSETDWRAHPILSRVGRRPVALRAQGTAGSLQADVVLERESAEQLEGNEALRELLSRARLVLVVD